MKDHRPDFAAGRLIAQAHQVTDRAFLESMIAGRINLLNPRLCADYLMPIHSRIAPGSALEALFERAALAFSDAARGAGYRCLSRLVCDAARDGTLGELREDLEAGDRDDEAD